MVITIHNSPKSTKDIVKVEAMREPLPDPSPTVWNGPPNIPPNGWRDIDVPSHGTYFVRVTYSDGSEVSSHATLNVAPVTFETLAEVT